MISIQSILLLMILTRISATAYGQPDDFHWSNCGGSAVHFNRLDIDPKPLVLEETSELFLTADVDVRANIDCQAEIQVQINKTINFGNELLNITLPCVQQTLGSCKFALGDAFNSWYKDLICPFFQQQNRPCHCPVKSGKFTLEHGRITVPFDQFKGFLALMASGDYNALFTIHDIGHSGKGDNLLACLRLHARLVNKST